MNETIHPDRASESPWFEGDPLTQEPVTLLLPEPENAEPAVVGLFNDAVRGTHNTVDRFADMATPVIQQLSESATAAEDTLHAKADQFRETRDEWVESMRSTVRGNPLAAVAAAIALGVLITRVTR